VQSAGVVDLIDEVRKASGHVFEGFVIHQVDSLDLKGLHEALGLGIDGPSWFSVCRCRATS
jgi:hypothetical protein